MLSILRSLSKLSLNFKRTTDLKHPYNKIGDGPEGPEARVVADKLKSNILLQASINPDNWISFDNWLSIFTHKKLLKKPICIVLMNQELIAGIGNYNKSEILYLS